MEITPQTKVHDLLKAHPKLESFLMALNPKYKKLKNPVLRRTVARIATLTQVAKIGGYEPLELVNLLRKEVGQPPLEKMEETKETIPKDAPEWIATEPKAVVNANELLDRNINPLAEVGRIFKNLNAGDVVLIESDFLPSPLIDTMKEKGHEVYAAQENESRYLTYIRK